MPDWATFNLTFQSARTDYGSPKWKVTTVLNSHVKQHCLPVSDDLMLIHGGKYYNPRAGFIWL